MKKKGEKNKKVVRVLILFVMVLFLVSFTSAIPVVPELYGFGTDTRAAYGAINDPVICIVNTIAHRSRGLTGATNNNLPDGTITRNGASVATGSFLECLNYIPPPDTGKIIMFEVSGTINAIAEPYAYRTTHQYLTIAGQTAPSPGITLRNIHLYVLNPDVLVQHIRSRVGDVASGESAEVRRCITAGSYGGIAWSVPVNNVVLDHCSTSWGIDTDITIWEAPDYAVSDITVSNCLIGEALRYSIHPKTIADGSGHSKGLGLQTGTETVSALYNLFISNSDRNPYVRWGSKAVINNLIYNPKYSYPSVTLTAGSVDLAVVGNVMTAGPSTSGWGLDGFIRLANNPTYSTNWDASSIYLIDNKWNDITQTNSEDWSNVHNFYSDDMDPYKVTGETPSTDAPLWPTGLTPMASSLVKDYVLVNVGARPADRDVVDERLINDVINEAGSLIDSPSDVGGWPVLAENTRTLTLPTNPHADDDSDGYTNLEGWIHGFSCDVEGPQSASCLATPLICNEEQITQICLCGGTEYSSGYCCSNVWQSTSCSVTSPSYTIIKTSTSPTIDGDISEFSNANTITLTNSRGSSGDYKLMWDNNALYIAADVSDTQLNADETLRDGSLWSDDSVEMMFDTLHDAGLSLQSDDYKFFVNVLNVQLDSRGGVGSSWNAVYNSAVSASGTINNNADTDTGYIIEIAILWLNWWVAAPTENDVWGFEVVMDDQDETDTTIQTPWSNSNDGGMNDPDGWGDIIFSAGSSCGDADSDFSGSVSITEVINYITAWKNGTVNINDLINGITEWKSGCS